MGEATMTTGRVSKKYTYKYIKEIGRAQFGPHMTRGMKSGGT